MFNEWMNEEDYEVDENRKPVSFRQRISTKNEEVFGSAPFFSTRCFFCGLNVLKCSLINGHIQTQVHPPTSACESGTVSGAGTSSKAGQVGVTKIRSVHDSGPAAYVLES